MNQILDCHLLTWSDSLKRMEELLRPRWSPCPAPWQRPVAGSGSAATGADTHAIPDT